MCLHLMDVRSSAPEMELLLYDSWKRMKGGISLSFSALVDALISTIPLLMLSIYPQSRTKPL